MILEDRAKIRTTRQQAFRFFEEMDRRYLDWHPDHVAFRWVKGGALRKGSEFYFEEYIAGKLLKKTVRLTNVVENEHVEFVPTWWLMRTFLPRMLFHIHEEGQHCVVTAQIHLRTGPLARWLNRKDLAAVRKHMAEEGENMRRILEQAAAVGSAG